MTYLLYGICAILVSIWLTFVFPPTSYFANDSKQPLPNADDEPESENEQHDKLSLSQAIKLPEVMIGQCW